MKLSFITPTEIDLRELFTLGLGSKRGDETKIGHKGSGMKFTLALLHRYGSSLTVKVGGETYVSSLRDVAVRGQSHQVIVLQSGDAVTETGIALPAGEDTWTEPWFALRELYQNMLDEKGTWTNTAGEIPDCPAGGTVMTIEMTGDFQLAWDGRFQWCHERRASIIYPTPFTCKAGLYYHGFQIYTEATWRFSYDVTTIIERENLSEDRQLRALSPNDLFEKLMKALTETPPELYAALLATLEDNLPEDLEAIERAIYHNTTSKGWSAVEFGNAFVALHGSNKAITNGDPGERERYYCSAVGREPVKVRYRILNLLKAAGIPTIESLMPSLHARLKPVLLKKANKDVLGRLRTARRWASPLEPKGVDIQLVEVLHSEDEKNCTAAMSIPSENKVLILLSYAERASLKELTRVFVEEFMHLRSAAPDCSFSFQDALINELTAQLMPAPKKEKPSSGSEFSL